MARTSRLRSLMDADLTDPVEVVAVDSAAVTDAEAVVVTVETAVEDTVTGAEVIFEQLLYLTFHYYSALNWVRGRCYVR